MVCNSFIRGIFVLIFILVIFICGKVILQDRKIVNVNSQNRVIITESLIKSTKDTDKITKVGLGRGFDSGNLYIYRGLLKVEQISISDTGDTYRDIEQYVLEYGHSFSKLAYKIGIISIILLLLIIEYKSIYTFIKDK